MLKGLIIIARLEITRHRQVFISLNVVDIFSDFIKAIGMQPYIMKLGLKVLFTEADLESLFQAFSMITPV